MNIYFLKDDINSCMVVYNHKNHYELQNIQALLEYEKHKREIGELEPVESNYFESTMGDSEVHRSLYSVDLFSYFLFLVTSQDNILD